MKILGITFILIIIGFQQDSDRQSFLSFISNAEVIKLPLNYSCYTIPSSKYELINNTYLEKFINRDSYFVGRIYKTRKFTTLIFGQVADNNYPVVYTFTQNGFPIDTLEMSGSCFTGPDGTEQTYSCNIETNGNFTITDTLKSYRLDQKGNIIPTSESLEIVSNRYKLNDSGMFTQTKTKKKKLK